MPFKNIDSDTLKVKYKQFKTAQKAAHELIQRGYGQQAANTYIELCALILDIEMELSTRQISLYDLQSIYTWATDDA